MMRTPSLPVVCAAAIWLLAACRHPAAQQKRVAMAASPDLAATGLPQLLLSTFAEESHVATEFVAADDAALVRAARAGTVDVAVANSPDLIKAMRNMKSVGLQSVFAYDDFILAGPKRDPARVRSAATAADAFRSIARRRQPFCSPSDVRAFVHREAEIWAAAKVDPKTDRHYRLCKGNAASALALAGRLPAYTITDRATFESAGRKLGLVSLLEGTAMLHNDYTVLLLTPPAKNQNAEWFVQWLMSYRGREVVDGYRFDGGRRFFLTEGK